MQGFGDALASAVMAGLILVGAACLLVGFGLGAWLL